MINTDMRELEYLMYGDVDQYGQKTLSEDVIGKIKISINISSLATQDNILYKDCSYIGITNDKNIDDTYVIKYLDKKLKVLYVNSKGRFTQVFLKEM